MSTAYSEQLKNPRWQKRRLEILNRDAFSCSQCGDSENTLHVHHRYYIAKRLPWEYPDIAYTTLCESCHEEVERVPSRVRGWEQCLSVAGNMDFRQFLLTVSKMSDEDRKILFDTILEESMKSVPA